MSFDLEQLTEYSNYGEICEMFLKLAKDEVTLSKLKDILYRGIVGGYSLKSKFPCRDNPGIERHRRISMASLFIRNPETFAFFEQNNINIFHGTNANAIPGILKYGMNSQKVSEEKGISVVTGEEWSRGPRKRDFVSFTDVLDVAEDYSSLSVKGGTEELSFSVVIGVSESELDNARVVPISSDISEIGVMQQLPLESISCICVPDEKIDFVKRLVGDREIVVLGMSDLNKKAHYIDEWNRIHISVDSFFNRFMQREGISNSEVEELAKTRSMSKMKNFIEKIKSIFVREDEEIGRTIK